MNKEQFEKRFAQDKVLGGGGFGEVIRARDVETGRYVAIKRSPKKAEYKDFTLEREYRLAKSLPAHENMLHFRAYYCFAYGMVGDMEFIVMDYYELGDLEAFCAAKPISDATLRSLLAGILQGLAFLHSQKIIHRDLKLSNVLVAEEQGRYISKLADFGLGKMNANVEKSSVSNSSIGLTLSYAAPEQIRGEAIRKNVDLWAFGVLLYKLQTGELPFRSSATDKTQKQAELRRQITQGRLPQKLNDIAEPYQSMIRRCLVVNRRKRVQRAEELLGLLSAGSNDDEETIIDAGPKSSTLVSVERYWSRFEHLAAALFTVTTSIGLFGTIILVIILALSDALSYRDTAGLLAVGFMQVFIQTLVHAVFFIVNLVRRIRRRVKTTVQKIKIQLFAVIMAPVVFVVSFLIFAIAYPGRALDSPDLHLEVFIILPVLVVALITNLRYFVIMRKELKKRKLTWGRIRRRLSRLRGSN